MWILCLFAMTAFDGPIDFKTLTTLEEPGEVSDYFMQSPSSFDVDADGNFYVVDVAAKVVFKWSPSGEFIKAIGKEGQGPGEFQFTGRGPNGVGYISVIGDTLFVYDGRKREVLTFSLDGEFQKSFGIGKIRSRAQFFAPVDENQFLLHRRRFGDEGAIAEIQLLSREGETLKTFAQQKDDTFAIRGSQGNRTFMLKAFNPQIVAHYNAQSDQLIFGDSNTPAFNVVNVKTGSSKIVRAPMVRADVTQADKDEYMQRFTDSRRRPQVSFPDQMPYYTHLLAMGDGGYLVYTQSPVDRHVKGMQIGSDGTVKGRFEMACGPGGGLMTAKGKLLAVTLDEEEEFLVRDIQFN